MELCGGATFALDSIRTHDDFVNQILRAVLVSNECFGDENVDTAYPADGYPPGTSDAVANRIAFFQLLLKRSARLYHAFTLLADNLSKELFLSLILFRILGYRRVRLPVDHAAYFAARDRAYSIAGSPSTMASASPPCSLLHHFEFDHDGCDLRLDCLQANLFFTFCLRQYHFERNGITIRPRPGDFVIDAGACFGDTALDFAAAVGPGGRVYSFEVLQAHIDILTENIRQNPEFTNITVLPVGLGNRNFTGSSPRGEPDPGYALPAGAPSRFLDSLVSDGTISRVDFIKMDIEGGELSALDGAVGTIRRFRPRLAISLYHHPKDYYHVPEFLEKLRLGYRLFLQNYTISDGETILYATCEET